ncbi:MAG: hypothetical protein R3B92_02920 [Patescibacteria group bacterium]
MSCNLESKYLAIPFKNFFIFLDVIPSRRSVDDSAGKLIGLSNGVGLESRKTENHEYIEQIKTNLGLFL